ncbi:MAG: type I DNA topoisomerase [Anaerolineaceae bacterium]|nr:type I DNA topoisomerase [Anaerolineaceae bacterium]
MEAYCLKCKEKRIIKDPVPGFTKTGSPITSGFCETCGSKLSKLGNTPAHEGLEKPEITKPVRKPKAHKSIDKKTKTLKTVSSKTRTTKTKNGRSRAIPAEFIGKGKNMVIVESPAKARTVGKFLGNDYSVIASVGHVRDLLKTQLSVDLENDFAPKYRISDDKKEIVAAIAQRAERSNTVYLATDPDREGEAIAWHIQESAEIPDKKVKRVVFHEITRDAISDAFAHPRQIDLDLVDAQQARRILDRLVGFGISPILWAKVRSGLSAGRVQSIALRLIVERERQIQGFNPVEYWVVKGEFLPLHTKTSFMAKFIKLNGNDPHLPNEQTTAELVKKMRSAAFVIENISKSNRRINPGAPFITSTLQQEASRRLGFTTKKTMQIAQQLYEGIDMGQGESTGLITYMRTDSVNLSASAVADARKYIQNKYGNSFLPAKPPVYRTRAASAQEAHEAIRPTSIFQEPDGIKNYLTGDQYKLYKLIWQRFLACQMTSALLEINTVDLNGTNAKDSYLFRASGSRTVFSGFQAVYATAKDEDAEEEDNIKLPLEVMKRGDPITLKNLLFDQHFTQPPPRFTEASLIQVLEENKIGRPSTYSPIISTIQERGYVYREAKRLFPTETGFLINDLVVEYFPQIVDINFTSRMEEELDEIAEGKKQWVGTIREFYTPFEASLVNAKNNMPVTRIQPQSAGRPCPQCGNDLVIRNGRFGKFISCSKFPTCRYTEAVVEKVGVPCPKCGKGDIVVKRSRKGRVFYGCSNYPDCDFVSWNKPVQKKCPECAGTLVIQNKEHLACLNCKMVFSVDEGDLV